MKLLYIAPIPIDFKNLDGVPKKILCQVGALEKCFDVDILYYFDKYVIIYNTDSKLHRKISKAKSKISVLNAARIIVTASEYNAVYIRYPRSDYFFEKLLKKLKRECIPVSVEIPTFPYDMEGFETLKGRIINILDRKYRKRLHKYVGRIVTYSDDKEIFGVQTINTINGIDFDGIQYDVTPLNLNYEINLIAVSAMYRVHGYERLIEGIHDYYKSGGKRKIHLKLVGEGDERIKYKNLVDKYGLEENVTFYGARFGEELEKIYEKNSVGINSLAIHRQGLLKESTLKTKEYAAKGLPMLSSSFVDALSENGNREYVMQIPADESNVDVNQLVQFIDSIYLNNDVKVIRKKIIEDGKMVCDINITMKPVIDYFYQSIGNAF